MTISNVTIQLLASLVGAALLGLIIGICLYRLRAMRQHYREHQQHQHKLDSCNSEIATLLTERDTALQQLSAENESAIKAREKTLQAVAQHDALQVHSRLQAQRLATMETEVLTVEERIIRIQSDFANYKANKFRELQMLRKQASLEVSVNELPVLNKRVASYPDTPAIALASGPVLLAAPAVERGVVADRRSLIAHELDIPSLVESELPDSVDALDFELIDLAEEDETFPHG